ncbi:MAG: SpoIID/LytB domain-containing protein [Myxococcota bacterium]|nr:SpoIID/LytB domain-containing protein [Myxococcota bacterium]
MRFAGTMVFAAISTANAAPVPPAAADRPDRLERLYNPGVVSSTSGEPSVRIRLLHGLKSVKFDSPARLTFITGEGQTSRSTYRGGLEWTVSARKIKRGTRRFWVLAERFPEGDGRRASAARDRWTRLGFATRIHYAGALYTSKKAVYGQRIVSVLISPKDTRLAAEREAKRLAGRHRVLGTVISQVLERPSAEIVARCAETHAEVVAKRLLTVQEFEGGTVEGVRFLGAKWRSHRRQERRFTGLFHFLVGRDGRLMVVNEVPIETAVDGVVPSESFPKADLAALQAQAVVARGHMLTKLGLRHPGAPYHLCATPHCQAYTGLGRSTPHTRRATRTTEGEVLVHNGALVDTMYHSTCGGFTEPYLLAGGRRKSPVMSGHADTKHPIPHVAEKGISHFIEHPPQSAWCRPTAERTGLFRWTVQRSGAQLSALVNSRKNIGPVSQLEIVKRGISGRVMSVKYHGEHGVYQVDGDDANRRTLGGLKSGLWIVERTPPISSENPVEPETWTFRGGGFGHGIGLCQHGALGMAAAGRDYRSILEHYYRKAKIHRHW